MNSHNINNTTGKSEPCVSDLYVFNPFDLCNDNVGIYDEFFNPDMNHDHLKNDKLSCQYYTNYQFSNLIQNQPLGNHQGLNTFSTLHLNTCSLPKNYDHLTEYLSTINYSFSMKLLSETGLNYNIMSLSFVTI